MEPLHAIEREKWHVYGNESSLCHFARRASTRRYAAMRTLRIVQTAESRHLGGRQSARLADDDPGYPGAREDREGNPFLCGTRETLQLGMREAGMDIHSVYVTYLLKRRPTRAYDKPATQAACLPHLQSQLLQKQPLVLFGFGNVVVEGLFPQKENATVKELRGSWHEFEGIPIGFTYHPLAVRRRPNLLRFFVEDLKGLRTKWEERAGRET